MSNPQPQPQQPSGSSAQIAAALTALYMWAQSVLLGGIARIARRHPPTEEGAQAALGEVRRLVQRVVAQLGAQSEPMVTELVRQAGREGGRDGGSDAGGGNGGGGRFPPPGLPDDDPRNLHMLHGERAAMAISYDLTSELQDVRYRITRLDNDLYKALVAPNAMLQVRPIGVTEAQAQAAAWREFTRRGIIGFTDKGGREWSMSAYVEMAVRTATTRAYNVARLAVLQVNDVNLVYVSDDGHPCPLCFPWQNQVLCIVDDGVHPTIAEAIEAGLLHPNCKHTWAAYFPGFTRLPPPQEWTQQHQDAYNATQKQRRLELGIRQAKQSLEYARGSEDRKAARQDVLTAQARIRLFMATQQYDLLRRSRREQPNLSMR